MVNMETIIVYFTSPAALRKFGMVKAIGQMRAVATIAVLMILLARTDASPERLKICTIWGAKKKMGMVMMPTDPYVSKSSHFP